MYNVRNKKESAKMYSVIGKATTGGELELVQNGMFGEIGERIEADVYEFLPVSATSKDIFVLATPEVDADESSFAKNSLRGFKLSLGEIGDATQVERHSKGEISEDMITVSSGTIAKGGYLYLAANSRKLTYKQEAPGESEAALLVAKIEDIVPSVQGIFVGADGSKLAPQVNNVIFRVIETV